MYAGAHIGCLQLIEIAGERKLTSVDQTKAIGSVEEQVVLLERNLYDHPLAALFWERRLEEVLCKHNRGKATQRLAMEEISQPTPAETPAPATQDHALQHGTPKLRRHGRFTMPPDSIEAPTQLLATEPTTQTSTNDAAELTDLTLGRWQEATRGTSTTSTKNKNYT